MRFFSSKLFFIFLAVLCSNVYAASLKVVVDNQSKLTASTNVAHVMSGRAETCYDAVGSQGSKQICLSALPNGIPLTDARDPDVTKTGVANGFIEIRLGSDRFAQYEYRFAALIDGGKNIGFLYLKTRSQDKAIQLVDSASYEECVQPCNKTIKIKIISD